MMIKQKNLTCLAAQSMSRSVNLLQNHQITLQWETMILTMRMADLLTLNGVLRDFMSAPEREWAATYVVAINERRLFVHHRDLHGFCALIEEAVDQLPRRTVRWIDFAVTIAPYHADRLAIGCFSAN